MLIESQIKEVVSVSVRILQTNLSYVVQSFLGIEEISASVQQEKGMLKIRGRNLSRLRDKKIKVFFSTPVNSEMTWITLNEMCPCTVIVILCTTKYLQNYLYVNITELCSGSIWLRARGFLYSSFSVMLFENVYTINIYVFSAWGMNVWIGWLIVIPEIVWWIVCLFPQCVDQTESCAVRVAHSSIEIKFVKRTP